MAEPKTIQIIELIIPIVISVIASSGFWLFVGTFKDRKSAQTELLIGLAHDRIVSLGMHYVMRGWITQDEYENLNMYLYRPYEKLGGNGGARRIMMEVDKLPIKKARSIGSIEKGTTDPNITAIGDV